MNEVVKIGSYEDDDNYGSGQRSKHHSSAAPFKHVVLSSNPLGIQKAVSSRQ